MNALSNIRVVELGTGIAGPYCTKLFVDAGADVVKVEPPGGDPLRWYTAADVDVRDGATGDGAGVLFRYLNAGKRSVIGRPGDADVDELVAGADLVVEDSGPAGLDIDALRAEHPQLVVLSITPFGKTGPFAGRVATEFTVQAESGTLAYRGRAARPPVQAGGRPSEFIGGVYAAPPAFGRGAARAPHRNRGAHRRVDDRGDGDRRFHLQRPHQPPHGPPRGDDTGAQRGDPVDRAGSRRPRGLQHERGAHVRGVRNPHRAARPGRERVLQPRGARGAAERVAEDHRRVHAEPRCRRHRRARRRAPDPGFAGARPRDAAFERARRGAWPPAPRRRRRAPPATAVPDRRRPGTRAEARPSPR